jgi:hypothetical protein
MPNKTTTSSPPQSLSWFWWFVWTAKVLLCIYAMRTLFFDPRTYLSGMWNFDISNLDIQTQHKIFAVVYQYAIYGSGTFILFLSLLLYAPHVQGTGIERIHVICFFIFASCCIDLSVLVETIFIYWRQKISYTLLTYLTIFFDTVWPALEIWFLVKYYPQTFIAANSNRKSK